MNEVHDFFKGHRKLQAQQANPEPVGGPTGFDCMAPLRMDLPSGQYDVPCRKCINCRKGWKQDIVGRVMGQALLAGRVYYITGTYGTFVDADGVERDKPGAMVFNVKHWRRFISRVRAHAKRRYGSSIRYFFAMQRGENCTMRCHLHAILMCSGPIGWDGSHVDSRKPVAPKPADPARIARKRKPRPPKKLAQLRYLKTTSKVVDGKLVTHRAGDFMDMVHLPAWPHGHLNIKELTGSTPSAMVSAVRYVARYAMREIDGPEDAPFGYSTDGLGYEFLVDLAQRHVEQGLIPQAYYYFDGIKFDRGKFAGQHERFFLRGAGAKVYAVAYREAYERKHPDATAPARPFHLTHDDGAIDPVLTDRHRKKPTGWKDHAVIWIPHDCTSSKVVHHWVPPTPEAVAQAFWTSTKDQIPLPAPWTREPLGSYQMDADGLVAYVPTMGGPPLWMGADVCQVEHLSDDDYRIVQQWADTARGPGWKPPDERHAERNAISAALLSKDIQSRLAVLVAQAVNTAPSDTPRNAIPAKLDPGLRRLILAAKLRAP